MAVSTHVIFTVKNRLSGHIVAGHGKRKPVLN